MDSKLSILSANCQGLRDINKRKDVFNYFKSKNHNIYCLQDTHFTQEIHKEVRSMWGYECHFSSVRSNSRGTAILINNNFEYKLIQEKTDPRGNYLILHLECNSRNLIIVSIYAPNEDKPEFFENIFSKIDNIGSDYPLIICGDFNLVIDPSIDYSNYLNINNPRARNKLLEIIENKGLIEIYI